MRIKFLLFFLVLNIQFFAQSLTFDEFFTYSRGILDSSQLEGIREILPEKFVITGADFGDISGDTLNDFAIAVRPSIRRSRAIYVYIFVDSSNSYIPVFSDTLKFVELPIEIAFTISEKICLITQKLEENSWLFTGYSFLNNELALVDIYETGSQRVDRRNKIGNESYENFKTMNSFNGYYNQASLKDFKKNKFYNFPVYEQKRNIYKNYTRNVYITSSWLWNDSMTKHVNYGMIRFTRNNKHLTANISLNNKFFLSDTLTENIIRLYFDREPERLLSMNKKREPVFRDNPDENIGIVEITLNQSDRFNSSVSTSFGRNYSLPNVSEITLTAQNNNNNLDAELKMPMNLFNTDTSMFGIYISLEQKKEGKTVLHLANSDCDADDPSGYGRLILIENGNYYGEIKNSRFRELTRKFRKNGW